MPEGDTIFRAARTLHRALAGTPVVRFESVLPALTRVHEDHPLTGRTVESVESVGKHLLMRFSGELVLRTHMRMNGSWHIYRPGEPWQRHRQEMRVVVATAAFEAVGFNIPTAEFIAGRDLKRHDELRRLGPDLLGETFDGAVALERARERPTMEIGDALLNQRVMAGVGNVYKSEVLQPVNHRTWWSSRRRAVLECHMSWTPRPTECPICAQFGHRVWQEGRNDRRVSPDEQNTSLSATTLAEIRRARVAAGWTLEQVAQRSRIPLALLQEFESGDTSRWPTGLYGRIQLVRYARASTLDPEVVVAAVWPLLTPPMAPDGTAEAVAVKRASPAEAQGIRIIALEFPSDDELFASEEPVPPRPEPEKRADHGVPEIHPSATAPQAPAARVRSSARRVWRSILGAGAAAALVAIGVWIAFVTHSDGHSAQQTVARSAPAVEEPAPSESASETEQRVESAPREGAVAATDPRDEKTNPSRITPAEPSIGRSAPAPEIHSPEPTPVPAGGGWESTHVRSAQLPFMPAHRAEGLPTDAALYSPAFAPIGNALFYHARRASRSVLMRADTDAAGSVLRVTPVVDDEARNFHARPSPEGTRIAFDSDRDGQRGVYIADADGRDARRVSGEGYAAVPSWSPDGRSLVFVKADPARPRVWNLWQLTLASGGLRQLTSHRYGQPWGGSWFPDGRRLAYSHEDRMIVLDLAHGTRRVYASPQSGRLLRTPAVSPDGRYILFQVFGDGAWMLDVSSGSMRKVLDDRSAEEYAWSPDGRRVAFHSRRSGQWGVWTMAMQ